MPPGVVVFEDHRSEVKIWVTGSEAPVIGEPKELVLMGRQVKRMGVTKVHRTWGPGYQLTEVSVLPAL